MFSFGMCSQKMTLLAKQKFETPTEPASGLRTSALPHSTRINDFWNMGHNIVHAHCSSLINESSSLFLFYYSVEQCSFMRPIVIEFLRAVAKPLSTLYNSKECAGLMKSQCPTGDRIKFVEDLSKHPKLYNALCVFEI